MRNDSLRLACALMLVGTLSLGHGALPPAAASSRTVTFVEDTGGQANIFNRLGYQGTRAAAMRAGLALRVLHTRAFTDDTKNLTRAARQSQIVVVVGPALAAALRLVAPRYPRVHFVVVDAAYSAPNVQSNVFDLAQASYLAGILAAGVSKRHTVGFVGGFDVPAIRPYLAAFQAGARAYNRRVHIVAAYTESFMDPAVGETVGTREIRRGADVLYSVADRAGQGVLAAAAQHHIYSIGLATDQNARYPHSVLTSVVKRIDTVTAAAVRSAAGRAFRGGVKVWSLRNGGVSLASYHSLSVKVPARVRAAIAHAKNGIASGAITVPAKPTR